MVDRHRLLYVVTIHIVASLLAVTVTSAAEQRSVLRNRTYRRHRAPATVASRHKNKGQPMDDEQLTIQIQDYEKGQMYDAVDQTIWYETPKNGQGEDTMTYSDNLAASENQRVEINSQGGGRTTATSTDIKPNYKRKARDADSEVIIRRYTVRRHRLKKAGDDKQRTDRKRKTNVARSTGQRPAFREKRPKDIKLLNSLESKVHAKAVGLTKDKMAKTKTSRYSGVKTRTSDRWRANNTREEKTSVGKFSETKTRQTNERTTNSGELQKIKVAEIDWSRRHGARKNASQNDNFGTSLVAADNEKFNYNKLLIKKDVGDFFTADADEFSRTEKDHLSAVDRIITINKRKPSGLEFDVDMETTDMTKRAIDETPNWIKDTNANANPMTIQGGLMHELKLIDNGNMMFQKFSDNPAVSVPWEEPEMLSNCWIQLMVSERYSFAPSCNEDGSFLAKQCFLERCWCVDRAGVPTATSSASRFYFKQDGLRLTCAEQPPSVTERPSTQGVQFNVANVAKIWPKTGDSSQPKAPAVWSLTSAERANVPIHFNEK